MALILGIETSVKTCSVALSKDGIPIAVNELTEADFSHAEKLHGFIASLFDNVSYTMLDIEAVAVSKGPGSYTGLRIGVSAAKGLCYGLDIPLIGVSTLEAMTEALEEKKTKLYVPLIDARRMEVFTAIYDSDLKLINVAHSLVVESNSFEDHLKEKTISFFGNGAEKCKAIIEHPNASFVDDFTPSAIAINKLAEKAFQNEKFEDVAYFEPFYLKDVFFATKKKA